MIALESKKEKEVIIVHFQLHENYKTVVLLKAVHTSETIGFTHSKNRKAFELM